MSKITTYSCERIYSRIILNVNWRHFSSYKKPKGKGDGLIQEEVILLSLSASVLTYPIKPTFVQMESRRKIK